jgi:tape measure domain-containing protein
MRAGTVEFAIVGDTRQFDTSIRQSEEVAKVYAQRTEKQFKRVQTSLEDIAKATGMPLSELKKLEEQARRSMSEIAASKDLDKMTKAMGLSADQVKNLERQMGLTSKTTQAELRAMGVSSDTLATTLGKVGTAVAAAFTVGALVEFTKSVGQSVIQMQSMERSFLAIAGSQGAAASQMRFVADVSSRLGLDLFSTAEAYKTLAAAAKGTTLEGSATRTMFEQVTKATTALGLSADNTKGVLLAMGQMISKGTVQAEEMRGQLGERLPGAFQAAARAMGVTTTELGKMMERGELLPEVFLPKLTAELEKMGAAAVNMGGTLEASLNRSGNAWTAFKVAIGDAGFLSAAQAVLDTFTGSVNMMELGLRRLSGTTSGAQREAFLQQSLDMLNGQDDWRRRVFGTESNGTKRSSISQELNQLRSFNFFQMDRAGAADFLKSETNATQAALDKQAAAVKGGEKAVLDAWASSSDKKVAAWATSQKAMREAYDKAAKGEITQGAMEALVDESQGKYTKAMDDIAKEGKKAGDSARKSIYEISEAMNKALGASEAWTGDAWSGKFRQLLADLNKDLKNAKTPAEEFWARWEYGAKKAKLAFDQWADSMKSWGDLQSQVGALSFDPGQQLSGGLTSLQAEQALAVKAAGDNQEKIAKINELYALKEVELREKTLGDAARLDDAYWARRQAGLEKMDAFLQAQGTNEHARAVYMAQQRDKLEKDKLEARMGYEADFSSYLADRLSLNYGLYKSSTGQTLDLWSKMTDSIIKTLDNVEGTISTVFGSALTDAVSGQFKGLQSYVDQLLSGLKQALISALADMAKIALHNYIVVPIIGQIMGTSGSFNVSGTSMSGGTDGQGGFSLDSASRYAGYGKSAYDMFGGTTTAASAAAAEAANPAFVGPSVNLANAGVPGSAQLTTMGALGAGAAAGGFGYMAGGFIRPDDPTASYVGAGAGLAAGTAAGMMGLSALSATGVGALVAIPAALVAGVLTPNTTTSSWNKAPGSGQAIAINNGEILPLSYGIRKDTTSGMFGSQSTSHSTVYQMADAEMYAAEQATWATATAGLSSFAKNLGVTDAALQDAQQGFTWMATPVPDGYEEIAWKNIANAEAEYTLTNLGLLDSVAAVAKEGEVYIDTLTRLGDTMGSMTAIAQQAGVDVAAFTQGMDQIVAADYVSRLADAAGGMDVLSAAIMRLGTYGYSAQERLVTSLTTTAVEAGKSIAAIGDANVTIDNFWTEFRAAMERGMDTTQIAAWTTASAKMEVWEQARAAALQVQAQAIQTNISAMQTQISVLQQLSSTWRTFAAQMLSLKQDLITDDTLSPLSPAERLAAQKSNLDSLTASVQSGDTTHLAEIDQATQDYLSAALDYYGATADYYAIFEATSATVDAMSATATMQAAAADQQIAQLNMQIAQNQAQLDALNNINAGLGDVVSAVNNVSDAIGGAMQAANAAQQTASVATYLGSGLPAPSTTDDVWAQMMAAYTGAQQDSGVSIPQYASGGLHPGGWFVAGEDPLNSSTGELGYSAGPVRFLNNRASRAALSGGGSGQAVDTSGIEARLDALSQTVASVVDVLADGGGAGREMQELRREFKALKFELQGRR